MTKVYASPEERAAAAERNARRRAGWCKAARIMPPEEIAALPPVPEPVRTRVSEDSETDDETFCAPQPLHVIKLSAQRRNGGEDVLLETAWVRQNFKRCGQPDRTLAQSACSHNGGSAAGPSSSR